MSANSGDARDAGSIPGSRRSLEGDLATHSSILALKIPWTEKPDRLQFTWLQTVVVTEHAFTHPPKTVFNPSQRAAHGQWLMWKFNDLSPVPQSETMSKAILSPQALIGHGLSLQLQPPCGFSPFPALPFSLLYRCYLPTNLLHKTLHLRVWLWETQSKTLHDIRIFSMERVHGVLNGTLSVIF